MSARLALQLYTFNHTPVLEERLALAAACDYQWVESEGLHGLPVADFLAALDRHSLQLASMHADLGELKRLPELKQVLRQTGCQQLVMPWLDEPERPVDRAGWLLLAQGLQQLAQELKADGVQLSYHNHAFEFARLSDHETVLDLLLAEAPDLNWQADVAWVVRAGEDPVFWLQRYAARLQSVHVKDYTGPGGNPPENDWATLGEGLVPWPTLLPTLQPRSGIWIVEHDQPVDPARTARQGLSFLQQHLN
ncbi:sugar phosphate isomerase/epimerase family protein [Leeia sp.]|uniref:sugar phosphate isomerase/epimerase family protein n=1 Tax=Leeia sp. TaxID=2884678 RepID=UPI0035AF5305